MTPTSQVKRMKKNDLFSLKITDMGVDGEGIGKYDGMTFFVKDALIGDHIRARATKLKKTLWICPCGRNYYIFSIPYRATMSVAPALWGLSDTGTFL